MARLYADENFPLPVVEELRRLGQDVLTIQETEQAAQAKPDETVLAFAFAAQRAVLTLNRKHFIRLHASQRDHAGVINLWRVAAAATPGELPDAGVSGEAVGAGDR